MTIGIDARAATEEAAGRGRYVRELLRALAQREDPHRYVLYARERWDEQLGDRFEWRTVAGPDPLWHLRAARAANRECDVFLSTNSYLTAWFLSVPAVTVVYDLVAFDRSLGAPRRSVWVERATIRRGLARSALVTCISENTARELVARHPGVRDRVVVTPLGFASLPEHGDAEGLPDRFVLAVGTLEPRKNLPRLAEAYGALPRDVRAEHPLLVAGPTGWQTDATESALHALGADCRLLGRVSDARLAALYRRCTVFCYPSLGEGFGLPVLEAMAAGAAVVTSDRSSLPEVGGDAVEYVDPTDTAAIAAALESLLRDPVRREQLAERARSRAREFTWERTAALTLEALERARASR
jgi:glycosyltransferase involved in cell wall biosynthesis